MNILVINTVPFKINGISTVIMNYYMYLRNNKELNFSFAIHTEIESTYKKIIKQNGDIIFYLPNRKKNIFKYTNKLKNIIKKDNFDIVHIHGNSNLMYLDSRIFNRNRCKVIVHNHNVESKYKILNRILKTKFKDSYDLALTCSETAGNWLYKTNYTILNNSIDSEKFHFNKKTRKKLRSIIDLDENDICLGFVGRLENQKNPLFLIHLLDKIVNGLEHNNYKLLIIGDGSLKKILSQSITEANLNENVIMLGEISNIEKYYNVFDLLLIPSIFEGLGIVAIEGQSNGLNTIASKNLPIETKVSDLIIYEELKLDLWLDKILEMKFSDREESSTIALDSIKRNGFDIAKNSNLLFKLYKNILEIH